MSKKKATNPWQIASERIVQLRFEVERILDDFTEDEKKSPQYHDLMETLNLLMGHALDERGINTYKRKIVRKGTSLIILLVGALIAKLTNMLILWLETIL